MYSNLLIIDLISVTPFLSLVFAFFYSAGNKLTLHDVSSSNISTDTHIYVLPLHVKSRETRRNGVRKPIFVFGSV